METKRNSSFELLRIISMFLIIFHHIARLGVLRDAAMPVSSMLWTMFTTYGGKIGVNVFVLISGYFLINDKQIFNVKKVFKLLSQIVFYSVAIYFLLQIFTKGHIILSDVIKSFMPITNSQWWFASTYFVLYLIHPFLNKLLLNLDKKTFQIMLLMGFVLFSLISTLFNSLYESNDLIWFSFLYCVASYIRLWGLGKELSFKKYLLISIVLLLITFFLNVCTAKLNEYFYFLYEYANKFFKQEKLLIFLISITLFMAFKCMNLKYSRFINTVASASFGVYLIHDCQYSRMYMWRNLFKIPEFQQKLCFIPYTIAVAITVFAVCSIIDLARIYLLEKPVLKIYDRYSDKCITFIKRATEKIRKIVFE